ncbi:MAG: molybdopterin synthase catalytic subunit MoaE [Kangiellaceae bacterium]|jgi:molybdopterin synthase catalytic subunit|nr:molybdopterin synthase catalytic subunit MoaE [Kangiellaceae bacterium]
MILVTENDFNVAEEYQAMIADNPEDGAVVFFVGLVRDFNQGKEVNGLHLQHYPAMTDKVLKRIVNEAKNRWRIGRVRVVHRVGDLAVNDQIVFVAVSSPHREDSFAAAQYIMDFLKTEAPFWKKEATNEGSRWVDAEEKNNKAKARW